MQLHHVPQDSEQHFLPGVEKIRNRTQLKVCATHWSFEDEDLKRTMKVRMDFRGEFWRSTENKVAELGNTVSSA